MANKLMVLSIPKLKEFNVSIILKKKDEIKKQKEKVERDEELKILKYNIKGKTSLNLMENMRFIATPKYLNLFSVNNITYKTFHQNISNFIINKKYLDPETRNIYIQTTLSSSLFKKKFQTPFQIMHLKSRIVREIYDYSKNNCKFPMDIKELKNKLLSIRSYSTKNNKRCISGKITRNNIGRNINITSNDKEKDKNKTIFRKMIKKNKTLNPTYLSKTIPINKNINESNNYSKYLRTVGNERNLKRFKSIDKRKNNPIKNFKPNCYYNKLNLKKMYNILKKYSYADS
jgi:hypothetical protein